MTALRDVSESAICLGTPCRQTAHTACSPGEREATLWQPVAVVHSLRRVQLFATQWTIAHQAPLSMGFLGKRGKGWLFPLPGDLPDPGMETASPRLAGGFFTTEPQGSQQARRGVVWVGVDAPIHHHCA